jgi:hypothetical protein
MGVEKFKLFMLIVALAAGGPEARLYVDNVCPLSVNVLPTKLVAKAHVQEEGSSGVVVLRMS